MKFVIIVLTMTVFLVSCETVIFDDSVTPNIVNYSKEDQEAAANELEACPYPVVREMMKDYHVMRNEARIARGEDVVTDN